MYIIGLLLGIPFYQTSVFIHQIFHSPCSIIYLVSLLPTNSRTVFCFVTYNIYRCCMISQMFYPALLYIFIPNVHMQHYLVMLSLLRFTDSIFPTSTAVESVAGHIFEAPKKKTTTLNDESLLCMFCMRETKFSKNMCDAQYSQFCSHCRSVQGIHCQISSTVLYEIIAFILDQFRYARKQYIMQSEGNNGWQFCVSFIYVFSYCLSKCSKVYPLSSKYNLFCVLFLIL